jgi:lipopolysaccharide export system permease protein
MKILDRYLIKEFLKPFICCLLIFTALIFIAQLFEELDHIQELGWGTMIYYFLYRIPFFLAQFAPVAVLLAGLWSLGNLSKNQEITAMKAGGISFRRILVPMLSLALIISLAVLILNESLIPPLNMKVKRFEEQKMGERPEYERRENVAFYSPDHRYLIYMKSFDGKKSQMLHIQIVTRRPDGTLAKRIDAQKGLYSNGGWNFTEGIEREFDPRGENILQEEGFEERYLPLAVKPSDFSREVQKPEELNLFQLTRYIAQSRREGYDIRKYLVDLHLKIASPFACLIILLVGAPLSTLSPRSGRLLSFGIAIFIGFFYWGGISVGRSLGRVGILSPLLAAWVANLLFIGLGLYLLRRAR